MASSASSVTLQGQEQWVDWNRNFIIKARGLGLWDYVNPESPLFGLFKEEPVRPEYPNFAALGLLSHEPPAGGRSTRRGTSNSSRTQTQTEMETGTQGSLSAPVNTLSDVLQLHRTTMVYYEDDKREWKMQRERLADLEKWVLETISPHLAEVACSPSEGVHQWYINLKNRTGVTPDVEIRSARDKYLAVLQQATKPPKDVKAWVRNWEEALTRAKTVGVKVAETAIDWWDAFSNAVTIFGYGDWARSYNMVHKEEIITNTLDYRKVVNDFMDCLRLPASKPKVVAKGVFPTFGTEDGRHDEESDTNSTQSTRDDRQKSSSLVERDYRRHKRQHSDGCQLCDENHTLDRCWIAIPELKPDWAIIPEDKKKKANERMEVDPSLKRLVQALRKKHKAEKRRSNRNKAKDKPDPGKRD